MKSKTRIGILSLVMTIAVTFCAACTATLTNAETVSAGEFYQEEVVYYELFEKGATSELKKISKTAYDDNARVEKKYREKKIKERVGDTRSTPVEISSFTPDYQTSNESSKAAAYFVIIPPEFDFSIPEIVLGNVIEGGTVVNGSVTATVICEVASTKRYRINGGSWISFSNTATFTALGYYQVNAYNTYGSDTATFTITDNYYNQQQISGTTSMAYARLITSTRYYPSTRNVVYQVKSIWDVLPSLRMDADVLLFSVDTRQSDVFNDPNSSITLSTNFRRKDMIVTYNEFGFVISVTYNEYDVITNYTYGFNGSVPNAGNDLMKVSEEPSASGKNSFCVKAYVSLPYNQPYTEFLASTTTLTVTTKVATGWSSDLGAVGTMAHTTFIHSTWQTYLTGVGMIYQNQSVGELFLLKTSKATAALVPNLSALLTATDFSALLLTYNNRTMTQFEVKYLHSSVLIDLP